MQSLFVNEADLARIREGELSALIRFGVKPLVGGPLRLFSGLKDSEATVHVNRIRVEGYGRLESDDFKRAGYRSKADFELDWTPHGVHLNAGLRMTIIEFELQ